MRNTSRGYIGLLALLIGVVIMMYLAAQQYEKIGQRRLDAIQSENAANGDTTSSLSPIDRALDVKAQAEARDRALFGQ